MFQIGDVVKYNGKLYEVVGVEEKNYSIDELTHMTQSVLLDRIGRPIDASELEHISPQDHVLF